jgi:hypothetical protein
VIIPASFIGISEALVQWAIGFCIIGLLVGIVINYIKPATT